MLRPTGPNAETFPRATRPDERVSWLGKPSILPVPLPFPRHIGLLERVPGNGMDIICAAGVGGGSLLYQGMSLQPSEAAFHEVFPEQLDYARLDRVHYPRASRMLQLATAPDPLINSPNYRASRIFAQRATECGYAVEKCPMPIDWSFAEAELRGEMKPSYTNGDCGLGANNGGKHSVDVTYIKAAVDTGRVEVASQHNVTRIALAKDGRWEVHVDHLDRNGDVLEQKIITTKGLVVTAGQANTTRLLMRAAATGTIPDLPDGLGTSWGSNGDRIYLWNYLGDTFGAPQGGPVIYVSKDWGNAATANTVIQASIPPISLTDPPLLPLLDGLHLPPLPATAQTTMLVGFGVSQDRGHFVYDSAKDDIVLQWPKNGDAEILRPISERITRIAGAGVLVDTNALDLNTWHPLGGAGLEVVCDLEGRVKGQRGLYVLDGALMPGSTAACNPSLTIAAIAERAMELVRTELDIMA
jgi:cholesterol oxidase